MQAERKVILGGIVDLNPELRIFRLTTDISDLELVDRLSNGKVDLTYGR